METPTKNEFKILDVNIDGVSMLVTQRAEFISVIKNSPDGVMGLIKKMKIKLFLIVSYFVNDHGRPGTEPPTTPL